MNDPVIPEQVLRVLKYVELVGRGGGTLTNQQIESYASTPAPEPELMLSGRYQMLKALSYLQTDGIAAYMHRLGWTTKPPVRLTDVGHAIIQASSRPTAEPELTDGAIVTVLSPEDPLNLFNLTGAIASARSGLLVEPYFEDESVLWLLESTSISRLLLCRPNSKRSRLEFAAGAAERIERSFEVRCLPVGALHDRYVVGENGAVSMIGASFNGIHKHFTAIVEVPEPGADAVRNFVEQKWEEAEKITPRVELSAPLPPDELAQGT